MTALEHPQATRPINGMAPEPLTNWGFCRILGKVLKRPSWVNAPRFMLRIVFGQVSSVATTAQRVLPRRAIRLGYSFQFPDLEDALRDLLKRPDLTAQVIPHLY
jgi:NAD dependent epimerase/dehydratase family enzyme